jgi:Na+-translocating ferredoxin:NAD+ oxidoreductase RnfD subunit
MTMRAMATTAPHAAPFRTPVEKLTQFLRTPKGLLTLLFLPLLALGGSAAGWPIVLPHVAAAVTGACLADVLLAGMARRVWRWPSSALLSGLIVAFVLEPRTLPAATVAIGALASVSKYLFRTRHGHVFNPAALALLGAIPLFGTGQSWWGALPDLPWPAVLVVVAGGALVADRVAKFPLALSFAGAYFGLLTLGAVAAPAQVAELFRAPFAHAALFLALFMLTDPPTAPGRPREQVALGVGTAAVAVAAYLAGAGQAYLLLAALAGNIAWAWQRWRTTRRLRAR